jgi:hypothetical protein
MSDMNADIVVKWNIEVDDADRNDAKEIEIDQSTEIDLGDAEEAFAEASNLSDITNEELEEYLKETVEMDFRSKVGPVIDADHLDAMVAGLRSALEKARAA